MANTPPTYLECSMGMEHLARMLETMVASRSVQLPDSARGSRMPLKKAAGLKRAFFSAIKRWKLRRL